MTTADDVFSERSASPTIRVVPLSHLSIELGHLYLEDLRAGADRLRAHFRRVRPWVRTAAEQVTAELAGRTPRISTCFLIDDFTRCSSPREVVGDLVAAAGAEGLVIDYVARESGCARAGRIDVARLVQDHLVDEPPEGSNGNRPPTARTGWLTNGVRSPGPNVPAFDKRAPRAWQPPRQTAAQNHSVFVDVELWSGTDDRLWSCPFLAAVWQLQRLGLLRHLGEPIAEPQPAGAADLPDEWEMMPPVLQLNAAAAPMRAYRTFGALESRFLHIEMAVRTILSQVGIDPVVDAQVLSRARAEGTELSDEIVGRIAYAFL